MPIKQNAADEGGVRNREELDQKDQEILADDTRKVMGTPEGRRLFWWLLDMAGIHRTSMTGNSYTYFNEGMRNVGLIVESHLIDHCDRAYIKMRDEQMARSKKRERVLEEIEKDSEDA